MSFTKIGKWAQISLVLNSYNPWRLFVMNHNNITTQSITTTRCQMFYKCMSASDPSISMQLALPERKKKKRSLNLGTRCILLSHQAQLFSGQYLFFKPFVKYLERMCLNYCVLSIARQMAIATSKGIAPHGAERCTRGRDAPDLCPSDAGGCWHRAEWASQTY